MTNWNANQTRLGDAGAAVDLSTASELVDRARRLVEPHAVELPAARFFAWSLSGDATGLRCLSERIGGAS